MPIDQSGPADAVEFKGYIVAEEDIPLPACIFPRAHLSLRRLWTTLAGGHGRLMTRSRLPNILHPEDLR